MEGQPLSRRIRIEPNQKFLEGVVPGHVWRTGKFKFSPVAFTPESERLNERIVDETVQLDSYNRFIEDPKLPVVYVVSGNPDDGRAKLFAAHLVQLHMKATKYPKVLWHSVMSNFQNPMLEPPHEPSMLVVTNLSPVATQAKLDKTRDILERFPDIPVVLVVAGEDPISFMATRLYARVNSLAYFCESLIKRRVEIL